MFHSVELRTYCHATEEEARVETALRALWPDGKVVTERSEGHHGNPLLRMSSRLEKPEDVASFWRRLRDARVVERLLDGLEDRVDDEAVLHFRVDKQRAFAGAIELARHDDVIAVRAKVVAHPAKKSTAVKVAREFLARL